jgi:hypothetical protein
MQPQELAHSENTHSVDRKDDPTPTHPRWARSKTAAHWLGAIALLTLSASCTNAGGPVIPLTPFFKFAPELSRAQLDIQVTPEVTPGTFKVKGTATLPEKTQMRVVAARYLQPNSPAARILNPKPTFSILDYRTAEIVEGQWQANLNLWQVSPDGRFREYWQQDAAWQGLPLKPDPDVVFLATPMPISKTDLLQQLEEEVAKRGKLLDSSQVRVLPDGQRYIQTSKTMEVALPTGSTTPPGIRPEEIHGGWGYRFLIPPEPINPTSVELPKHRRTNAAPVPEEFMR